MSVPACGRPAPTVPRLRRRKAGPSSPTSSLSAGKGGAGQEVTPSALGGDISPEGTSPLPSTALNQGPGVAPRWTRATAIPRRGRTRAQREPVSRRGSEHREWGGCGQVPRSITPRGKPAVLGVWVWPAALSMLLGALAGSEGFHSPGQSLRPCFVWAGHPGAVCPLTGHPRPCLVSLTLSPSSDRLGSPTGLGGGPSCLGEDCLFVRFL